MDLERMRRAGPPAAGGAASPAFLVGHGALSPERLVQVAPGLAEWIGLGCPLGDED